MMVSSSLAGRALTPTVELESFAIGEMMGARKIEEKARTRIGDEADTAAVTVEIRQCHRVDSGLFRPFSASANRYRPPHSGGFTMRQ